MTKITIGLHMKSFTIILMVIAAAFIGFVKVVSQNTKMHTYHYEKAEVVEVVDCYDGSFTVCKIQVEFNNEILNYEIKNKMVEVGDPLYKHCFYRGQGYDNRRCYRDFKSSLNSSYKMTYQDVKNDVLN